MPPPDRKIHLPDTPSILERRHAIEERALFDAGHQVLGGMLQGLTGVRQDDVKDAVQDALLIWLSNPPAAIEPWQVAVWLRTTADHRLWRILHRNDPVGSSEDPDDQISPDLPLDIRILVREIVERHAANLVTGRTRDILVRTCMGASAQELADDHGLSVHNVRQKMHRGWKRLRGFLRLRDKDVLK